MLLFAEILAGVVVVVLLLIGFIASRPSNFRYSRSKLMSTTPGAAFELVNDFHHWHRWSPWEKLDPKMTRTYEGASSGIGAIYKWTGNDKVGEGSNTIVESRPSELVRMKLIFLRPFKATNDVEFTFQEQGEQTLVTWTMSGHHSFMPKVIGLFMNMEKMIGNSFDEGLTTLKSLVEAGSL